MTSWTPNSIRAALVALTACMTGSCTGLVGGDVASIYEAAKQTWSGGGVTLQQAAAVPYASIGVRIGNSSQMMLVLASDQNGERLWTSAQRIAITTRDGRIVRTAGLGHDLGGYFTPPDQNGLRGSGAFTWQADYPDLGAYGVAITCTDHVAGSETIAILGKEFLTRRIDEQCTSQNAQVDWRFRNAFWLDPDSGFAWRSVQHVNPKLDPIEIETLRPPK